MTHVEIETNRHPNVPAKVRLDMHTLVDATFCSLCGERLVVGPVKHETETTRLDVWGHDLLTFCTCGWRHDDIWVKPEKKPRSQEKADAAIKKHKEEAPDALRCPNEDRAR